MTRIEDILREDIHTVGIAGHVNPDGDCAGSCTAMLRYLKKARPSMNVRLYLEETEESLKSLDGMEAARTDAGSDEAPDLFIVLDTSSPERIGVAGELFGKAKLKVCIDHHISNTGYADVNHIEPHSSSCCEVLAGLMNDDMIDRHIAESLYTGIVHDCGFFQYSNTSPSTLRICADLMEKGIDFQRIADETFHQRSYEQNRVLGLALSGAKLFFGGQLVYSCISLKDAESCGVTRRDLGVVVPELRFTRGAEAAVFLYEVAEGGWKASIRTNHFLDASKVCSCFGGGGHVRAAGFSMNGKPEEIRDQLFQVLSDRFGMGEP